MIECPKLQQNNEDRLPRRIPPRMSYLELLYYVPDLVASITFNQLARMNAWTPTMERELRSAVSGAFADDGVRSIVLTGAGWESCAEAGRLRLHAEEHVPGRVRRLRAQRARQVDALRGHGEDRTAVNRFATNLGIQK